MVRRRRVSYFSCPRVPERVTDSADDPADRRPAQGEVFCRDCGAIISDRAEICPECGIRQRPPPQSSLESTLDDLLAGGNPFVAALLSALFPGLGQLYNRELERGLAFVVASLVALFSALALVGFVLFPAIWVYSIYDAYTRAERPSERPPHPDPGREPAREPNREPESTRDPVSDRDRDPGSTSDRNE